MDGYTRAEVERLRREGRRVVLLDVRSAEEFAAGTVDGARHAPAERLDDERTALPSDALVVAVCNHGGPRSQGAAQKLRDAGFADARHLVGGVKGGSH